ncbi:MAG TPA: CPBP family intramembrane glutamic endopeptidase [Chitinophagaceae bacterium]|nr:CPBP family intramembrane glutamic endopeptidase [Chitinophagaceae bacterium]
MNIIFSYLQDYFKGVDKWLLFFCAGFAAILIIINYRLGVETKWLYGINNRVERFFGFYTMYAVAFIIPLLVLAFTRYREALQQPLFWLLLLAAPALFALKVSFTGLTQWVAGNDGNAWRRYYAIIINLPSRLLLVLLPLLVLWYWQHHVHSFWGLSTAHFNWRPYALMLLIMVPLVAFASTQADFLRMYPKLQQVAFIEKISTHPWWHKLLFELSYGLDFLSIELFFRGFLVFAFVRYLGPDAVLPMAVFYCSIHFGKPLFECISSFFGGMLLGIIAYRTQSIMGGIMVHLGIAWMMELGGYLGNNAKHTG